MKRILGILISILCSVLNMSALTIPQGTIYFDNSKTQYTTVRFVFGTDEPAKTYVREMYDLQQGDNRWMAWIPNSYPDMYRFTFVGGEIADGEYDLSFSDFKEYVSHTLYINRTATSEAQMNNNDIFVPESGDNWAQGSWMSLSAWEQLNQGGGGGESVTSGTLAVVYVNTENGQGVYDTETQIKASMYIDSVNTKYHPLGSASEPIGCTIKGRGNWTWSGFDKKPYKLKFDVKHKVMGMPNNRHWCLMASTDDNLGFLRLPAGLYLSKALGLRWTPRIRPVEFVLNGQYMGLYFLTEHVRIASNRVKIKEQADNETRADSITGGWLVEIDNYQTENNIEFYEEAVNNQRVMISLREPDVLTSAQRTYLETELYKLHTAIEEVSPQLGERLDLDEAAKYYIVQEIMEDCESYHGSCFLYKDRDSLGVVDKWKFGPVWDFGNAYNRKMWNSDQSEAFIYENPSFEQYWIGQIAKNQTFQQKVKENWWVFYHTQMDSVRAKIETFAQTISTAAQNDAAKWQYTQGYNDNSNMSEKLNSFLWYFDWRIQWLYSQWGEGIRPATWDNEEILLAPAGKKFLRNGQLIILRNGHEYTVTGQFIR